MDNNKVELNKCALRELSLAYTLCTMSRVRYLLRELKINPYYDTTVYVNGRKIALVLV